MILNWKLFESFSNQLEECKEILLELEYKNFQTEVKIVNANTRSGVPMWRTVYWRNKGITNDFLMIDIKKIIKVADSTFSIRKFQWGEIKETVLRLADFLGVDYKDVVVSYSPDYSSLSSVEPRLFDLEKSAPDDLVFDSFSLEIKLDPLYWMEDSNS